MKKIKLAEELEQNILQAIRLGLVAPDIVEKEELSKKAQAVYLAINHLLKKKVPTPIKTSSIQLAATTLLGVPPGAVTRYLGGIESTDPGVEVQAILRSAREKALLVGLINTAGAQLASGDVHLSDLTQSLERGAGAGDPIVSLGDRVKDRFPKPPVGFPLGSLPKISDITNGLFGIWIIGGEPGLGKSTLSFQIALDVAENYDAVYYDLDGTGESYFLERARHIFRDNIKAFKKATSRLFFRPTISTLESDLNVIKPPALLVVDSVQTLPTSVKFSKQSLDDWIRRFKNLTKKGYAIMFISEKARSEYGEANLSGYKGSGDLEYGGTMCAQLLADPDDEDIVQYHIMKNRHGKDKGHITDLERDEKRIFWFKEVGKQ
jgi:hypothetical protein